MRTRFGKPAMVGQLCGGCSTTARFALGPTSQFALPASRGRGSKLTWRTGCHQTECGRSRSVARLSAAVAKASESSGRAGDRRPHIDGHGRSAGGEDRAHPVFQPSNGEAHRNESPVNSGRFNRGWTESRRQGCAILRASWKESAFGLTTDCRGRIRERAHRCLQGLAPNATALAPEIGTARWIHRFPARQRSESAASTPGPRSVVGR